MRETMNRKYGTLKTIAAVAIIAALSAGLAGCSLIEGEEAQKSVSEYGGLYHFLVPESWRVVADSAIIAVYAAEEMPDDTNALETLSLIVVNQPTVSEDEVPALLTETIEVRSTERSWQNTEITEPEEAVIGGRAGYVSEVQAETEAGVPFSARYYMIRTSGTDVLIVATMPVDRYEEFSPELDSITENWFWHAPESKAAPGSEESTATTETAQ